MPPGFGGLGGLQNAALLRFLAERGLITPTGQNGAPASSQAASAPSPLASSMPQGLYAPGGMVKPGQPIVRDVQPISAMQGAPGWQDMLKMGAGVLGGSGGSEGSQSASGGLQSAGLYMPNLAGLLQPLPAYANRSPLPGLFG